jgi:hypothetical protein
LVIEDSCWIADFPVRPGFGGTRTPNQPASLEEKNRGGIPDSPAVVAHSHVEQNTEGMVELSNSGRAESKRRRVEQGFLRLYPQNVLPDIAEVNFAHKEYFGTYPPNRVSHRVDGSPRRNPN